MKWSKFSSTNKKLVDIYRLRNMCLYLLFALLFSCNIKISDDKTKNEDTSLPGVATPYVHDTVPPSGYFLKPVAEEILFGDVEVQVSASDNYRVRNVTLAIVGESNKEQVLATLVAAPYVYSLDTKQYDNGSYQLQAVVEDFAGYKSLPVMLAIEIDNDFEAPVVDILTPVHGAEVVGGFEITIAASDNKEINLIEVYLGQSKIATFKEEPFTANVEVNSYATGDYPLKAIAYDSQGNEGIDDDTNLRIIDQTPPSITRVVPGDNATNVDPEGRIIITFSEPLLADSIVLEAFAVRENAKVVVYTLEYQEGSREIEVVLSQKASYGSVMDISVFPQISDLSGNVLADQKNWSYSIQDEPIKTDDTPDGDPNTDPEDPNTDTVNDPDEQPTTDPTTVGSCTISSIYLCHDFDQKYNQSLAKDICLSLDQLVGASHLVAYAADACVKNEVLGSCTISVKILLETYALKFSYYSGGELSTNQAQEICSLASGVWQ